jgi:hypothetical protein
MQCKQHIHTDGWNLYLCMSAAMAANPLAVNLASTAGINISWGTWALAGAAPQQELSMGAGDDAAAGQLAAWIPC